MQLNYEMGQEDLAAAMSDGSAEQQVAAQVPNVITNVEDLYDGSPEEDDRQELDVRGASQANENSMNESGASAAGLGINGSQPVDNISSHGKNGSKAAHTTKDSNVMIQNKRKGYDGGQNKNKDLGFLNKSSKNEQQI